MKREQREELRRLGNAAQNPNDEKDLTRFHCTEEAAQRGRFVMRHGPALLAAAERVEVLEAQVRELEATLDRYCGNGGCGK